MDAVYEYANRVYALTRAKVMYALIEFVPLFQDNIEWWWDQFSIRKSQQSQPFPPSPLPLTLTLTLLHN